MCSALKILHKVSGPLSHPCISYCQCCRPRCSWSRVSGDSGPWGAAVREQAPGEIGAGHEGAEEGAALLLHDLVDSHDKPPVRHGQVEGSEVVLRPSFYRVKLPGAMQRPGSCVRKGALLLVSGLSLCLSPSARRWVIIATPSNW